MCFIFCASKVGVTLRSLLVFICPALTSVLLFSPLCLSCVYSFFTLLFHCFLFLSSFFLSVLFLITPSLGPPPYRDQVICLLAPGRVQRKQRKRGLNFVLRNETAYNQKSISLSLCSCIFLSCSCWNMIRRSLNSTTSSQRRRSTFLPGEQLEEVLLNTWQC